MTTRIAIFGASGAIGHALGEEALARFPDAHLFAASRSEPAPFVTGDGQQVMVHSGLDLGDEASIAAACEALLDLGQPDIVLVASGVLHGEGFGPERSIRALDPDAMEAVFQANLFGPALILKHLLPRMARHSPFRAGLISARVGSISDNRLGGWYSYRASKAALNMMVKTASIELARRNREAVLVGLHPGTVDSALSEPFQGGVPDGKLFSAQQSAHYLLDVLTALEPEQSGLCFDWKGEEITP